MEPVIQFPAPACRLMRYKLLRARVAGRVSARAYAAAGACVLWLFTGTIEGGRCGESQAPALATTTGMGYKLAEPNVTRKRSGPVTQVAEITATEPKQSFERARIEISNVLAQLAVDAGIGKTLQASQSVPNRERKQALEWEQEWSTAEDLVRALTSRILAELDIARSTAEAAEIKQRQGPRADMLSRALTTLQSELETARAICREAVKQTVAFEQERDRVDNLARELVSVRAELDAARAAAAAGQEGAQAIAAASEQKQVIERELQLQRETKQAIAAVSSQKQAVEWELEQQRAKAQTLARDLTSVRAVRGNEEVDVAAKKRRLISTRKVGMPRASAMADSQARQGTLGRLPRRPPLRSGRDHWSSLPESYWPGKETRERLP